MHSEQIQTWREELDEESEGVKTPAAPQLSSPSPSMGESEATPLARTPETHASHIQSTAPHQTVPGTAVSDMDTIDKGLEWERLVETKSPVTPSANQRHGTSQTGYFSSQGAQHIEFERLPQPRSNPTSSQTSSNSLHALSELERHKSTQSLRKSDSVRSASSNPRGRPLSHSKSSSTSYPASPRLSSNDHPVYPDQSFASLQSQFYMNRTPQFPRTPGSHPLQTLLHENPMPSTHFKDKLNPLLAARTAGNTPLSTPGLFSPTLNSRVQASALNGEDLAGSGSPQLHPTHLQTPRETHTADIDHDVFTGNKFINNYEIKGELGRGEYGKVKLGRDVQTDSLVAIKIVLRYSKKRRLGKLGAPEDRVKKEVAILKKARHPNVVSLLEVIDDPSKNKVYIVLEFVEHGEIKWRKLGVREVLTINHLRFEQERLGRDVPIEVPEHEKYQAELAKRRHAHGEERARVGRQVPTPGWSLEHGFDTDEESGSPDIARSLSQHLASSNAPSRTSSRDDYHQEVDSPLAGSMYGSYVQEAYHGRKYSIATSAVSHMSSEHEFELDDQNSYVPALTFDECRKATRDVLLGLEFLHYIGIIHRDIKPANLLVSRNGDIKISDFGVSYFGRPTNEEDPECQVSETDATYLHDERELARSVGTPAFWAPELCYEDASMFVEKDGPRITGALDLWSLGITLYCMVYARLPFYSQGEVGLHTAICQTDVFLPKVRLVPVDTNASERTSEGLVHSSKTTGKRSDYDLEFEEVPEEIRDLIRRLLIKDPAKRIPMKDAKRHPWIIHGIQDPEIWLMQTNPAKVQKSAYTEPGEKELSHAVVKRNIIERAISGVTRIAGNFLGRREARKRAPSAATSASASSESIASPSGSSGSTVGKAERSRDSQRQSLKGDEFANALKASREPTEHPLAQSQTASPVGKDVDGSYFAESSASTKTASAGATLGPEEERRPRAAERVVSAMSTTGSVKTIRASQNNRRPSVLDQPQTNETSKLVAGATSSLGAIFSGATNRLAGMRSRERRPTRDQRAASASRTSSESDPHSRPSIALSTQSVTGDFETPEALREEKLTSPRSASAAPAPRRHSLFQPPESSDTAFEQAQAIQHRRYLQERQIEAEKEASRPGSQAANYECPPSPDDIAYGRKIQNTSSETSPYSAMQTLPSASTIASSAADGYSCVSQSLSNPSMGIISGASSPPTDFTLAAEKDQEPPQAYAADTEPEFMRTADTLKEREHPVVATGASLEQQHGGYDDDGDDDYDYSSEDEGIVMGGPAKKK